MHTAAVGLGEPEQQHFIAGDFSVSACLRLLRSQSLPKSETYHVVQTKKWSEQTNRSKEDFHVSNRTPVVWKQSYSAGSLAGSCCVCRHGACWTRSICTANFPRKHQGYIELIGAILYTVECIFLFVANHWFALVYIKEWCSDQERRWRQ